MQKKVTLLLDEKALRKAMKYAFLNRKSLSGLVEKFFIDLHVPASMKYYYHGNKSSVTENLAGILKDHDPKEYGAELLNELEKKTT